MHNRTTATGRPRHTTIVVLILGALLWSTQPTLGPPPAEAAVGQYSYRADFRFVPGLSTNSATPTLCTYNPARTGAVCRLLYGVEEAGYKTNWTFPATSGLAQSSGGSQFGYYVITKTGAVYEGCSKIDGGRNWYCDYYAAHTVNWKDWQTKGYELRVLRRWSSYVSRQLKCALATSGWWADRSGKAFTTLMGDCLNGPM